MDAIETMVLFAGEDAVLKSPASTARFDPNQSGDYQAGRSVDLPIRVFPDRPEVEVVGASTAVTFSASEKPAGLKVSGSTLVWRGETWKVVQYQTRSYLGRINGFTLFLGT